MLLSASACLRLVLRRLFLLRFLTLSLQLVRCFLFQVALMACVRWAIHDVPNVLNDRDSPEG